MYSINIIFTLTASDDARGEQLHGVQQLARLSLAPMRNIYDPVTDLPDMKYGPGTRVEGLDKRDALLVMSCLDLGAMLVFLGVLAWFKRAVTRDALQADLNTITITDYSTVVYGLPAEPLTAEEVSSHLEEALPALKGQVSQVFVGKAFGEFLERLQAKGAAEEALDSLDAKGRATGKPEKDAKARAKLVAQIERLDADLADLNESALNACCAFVTFRTTAARDAALAAFPGGALRAALPMLQPVERRFRGKHTLRMREAEDPTDILWENLHYSAAARQARQGVSGWFVFALLLGTIGITISAKSYENEMPPTVACTALAADDLLECDTLWNLTATTNNVDWARVTIDSLGAGQTAQSCDPYIGATTGLWNVPWAQFSDPSAAPTYRVNMTYSPFSVVQCAARVCHGCYCQARGFFGWYQNKQDLGSFCDVYWEGYLSSWALKGMSILFVILSNLLFTTAIPILTRYEKLPSRGAQETSTAIKTFLSTFFNAYVVTLLVYASITQLEDFPLIFKGAYTDFDASWYVAIGSSLFVTTFTQAVQPPLQSAAQATVLRFLRRFQVGSQYTQRDLNALLMGPEWSLATRVAQLLNAAWLALVLCGSIPGAGFLLTFLFWLSYWCDKYFLCRIARTPPRYDASMVLRLRSLLVWGVWLHLAVTAWAFGTTNLPSYHLHLDGTSEFQAYLARATDPDGSNGQFNVGARLEKWQCLVQGLPFLMLSTWLFVIKPYGGAAVAAVRACLPKKADSQEEDAAVALPFEEALKSEHYVGPTSYNIRDNPNYQAALRALQAAPEGVADADDKDDKIAAEALA